MIRISLIIATYNRAEHLVKALESVVCQNLRREEWECIVVDNNSKDNTRELFDKFCSLHSDCNLRYIFEQKQGLSHARNAGIVAAQGEIVAIIDDDERINEEFLAAYLEVFDTQSDAMSAGGRVVAQYDECERPEWMSALTEQPIANPMDWGKSVRVFPKGHIPAGGNMAFRREVFDRFGLFNPELGRVGERLIGGEESDLFARLERAKAKCYYVPNAIMWHLIPKRKLSAQYFDSLCYNIGVSQRLRAEIEHRTTSLRIKELCKWAATLVLFCIHTLSLHPQRGVYLLKMRRAISRGVFE